MAGNPIPGNVPMLGGEELVLVPGTRVTAGSLSSRNLHPPRETRSSEFNSIIGGPATHPYTAGSPPQADSSEVPHQARQLHKELDPTGATMVGSTNGSQKDGEGGLSDIEVARGTGMHQLTAGSAKGQEGVRKDQETGEEQDQGDTQLEDGWAASGTDIHFLMEEAAKIANGGVLPDSWFSIKLPNSTKAAMGTSPEDKPSTGVKPSVKATANLSADSMVQATTGVATNRSDDTTQAKTLSNEADKGLPMAGKGNTNPKTKKPKTRHVEKLGEVDKEVSEMEDSAEKHAIRPIVPKAMRRQEGTVIGAARRITGQPKRGAVSQAGQKRKRQEELDSEEGDRELCR